MSTDSKQGLLKRLAEREKAPETHLLKTIGFWLAVAPPLIIGIALATWAGVHENQIWSLTFQGYNSFLKDFKLPIGIMGLSIPLGALAAAVHRSVQTSRQIIEQNEQNIFSNYLEHRKYFLSFVDEHQPFSHLKVSAPHLYQRLFPESANGPLAPANASIDDLLNNIEKTAVLSMNAVENKLSAKNFKIIDKELAFYLGNSTKLLGKFIKIPKFNIKSAFDDPLTLLGQTLRQNLDGITGIIVCANFHKTYRKEDDLSNLKLATEFCLNNINAILQYYNLWMMLKAELSEQSASNPGQPIERRLANVKLNMEANNMEPEHLEVIFNHHLTEEEKAKALEHGPAGWRILLTAPKN